MPRTGAMACDRATLEAASTGSRLRVPTAAKEGRLLKRRVLRPLIPSPSDALHVVRPANNTVTDSTGDTATSPQWAVWMFWPPYGSSSQGITIEFSWPGGVM